MDDKLLSLPWQIQVALGAGYLAYLVAYSGIRDHHKGIDVPFRAIAFGLSATALLYATADWRAELSILAACTGALIVGILWRVLGRPLYKFIMRKMSISWSDDTPSAWSALALENTRYRMTQLSVKLIDGRRLHCTQVHRVGKYPFGPCVLGNNGDVAMYVDREDVPGQATRDYSDLVMTDGWGAAITFIPANQIQMVEMRFVDNEGRKLSKIFNSSSKALEAEAAG